jgi:hypothetical protein
MTHQPVLTTGHCINFLTYLNLQTKRNSVGCFLGGVIGHPVGNSHLQPSQNYRYTEDEE